MSLGEGLVFLIAALSIGARFLFPGHAAWAIGLTAAAALALLYLLQENPARWQMYPAVMGLAIIGLAQLPALRDGFWLSVVSVVLLAAAALLTHVMPLRAVPTPTGPHAIGTVQFDLERPSDEGARTLFVKLWYPAEAADGRDQGLWQDMQDMDDIPAPMRMGLSFLHGSKTHSVPGVQPMENESPIQIIVYNHSYVSWASENTLLMEDLASRGFLVVSVRHMGQYHEQAELDAGLSQEVRATQAEITEMLAAASTREERAALSALMAAASISSGEIVRRRAEDTAWVFRRLPSRWSELGGDVRPLAETFSAMGFSLGGAVATKACTTDSACTAVVNIDGGLYGLAETERPQGPYLMVYSGENVGGNDLGLPVGDARYRELTFERSRHGDFHDAAYFVPAMPGRGTMTVSELLSLKRRLADEVDDFLAAVAHP